MADGLSSVKKILNRKLYLLNLNKNNIVVGDDDYNYCCGRHLLPRYYRRSGAEQQNRVRPGGNCESVLDDGLFTKHFF